MYIEGCIDGYFSDVNNAVSACFQLQYGFKVHDNLLATADEQFLGVCGKNMNFAIE